MTKTLMTVTFTKVDGAPAIFRWPDGVVASVENSGLGFPHDLSHWLIQAQVDLPWGFWALAGRQAPFDTFTLVKGRWPKGKHEFLDRVRRHHRDSMTHAEAAGGSWLTAKEFDVRREWSSVRRRLVKAYAFTESPLAHLGPEDCERMRAFAQRALETWDALPVGGSIEVRWPGANELAVVSTSPA